MKYPLLFAALLCGLSINPAMADIYVAPSGNDSASGSEAAPFATLQRAQAEARLAKKPVTIQLHGGIYNLKEPLVLTSDDAHETWQAVKGETLVLSGGRTITGWSLSDAAKNIWVASCPGLDTRQLFVDGVRAPRAHSGKRPDGWTKTVSGYTAANADMAAWRNPSDIEFVYNAVQGGTASGQWTERRCGVQSITGNKIIMKQPCWGWISKLNKKGQPGSLTATIPTDIENAYELLAKPGEWYLDRPAGKLYYIPLPNQDLKKATVIAPILESLVILKGTPKKPIHDITFEGLAFLYTTWLVPDTGLGFPEAQANYCSYSDVFTKPKNRGISYFPTAAVTILGGRNIRVERCFFTHLGGVGLEFSGGSHQCAVVGSVFTDISSMGVRIGQVSIPKPRDPALEDEGIEVSNCYLHDLPAEYRGGVGIFAGFVRDLLLTHNELEHLPYTGISVGWGWGRMPSFAKNNQIIHNDISDYTGSLTDGGAIYTLDAQGISLTDSPSLIAYNYCHDAAPTPHGYKNAIYNDEGSAYFHVQDNVCARLSEGGNWYSAWTNSIHDDWITDNYTDTAAHVFKARYSALINNHVITSGQWPKPALDIIAQAGLEKAYQDIRNEKDPATIESSSSGTAH